MKEKTQFAEYVTPDAKTHGKDAKNHRIGPDMPPELSPKIQKRRHNPALRSGGELERIE